MPDAIIREATSRDIKAIVELWSGLQEVNAIFDPRLTPNAAAGAWFSDFLEDHIGSRHSIVFVAELDSVIVGYVFAQIMTRPTLITGNCGYIADLYVRSEYQTRGLGRNLYHRVRDWFDNRQVKSIEVQIIRANPGSQAFWRKMGFQEFLRTLRTEI